MALYLLGAWVWNDSLSILAHDTYSPPIERARHGHRHIRVLRWTFRRADDVAICELALTGEDRGYELRAPAEWNWTGRPVERFDDALTAFQRHAMIERTLLDAAGCSTRSIPNGSHCTSVWHARLPAFNPWRSRRAARHRS